MLVVKRFFIWVGGVIIGLSLLGGGTVLYWAGQAEHSRGKNLETVHFSVERGEGMFTLAARLERAGVINSRFPFILYLLRSGQYGVLQAGEYLVSGHDSISDLVERFASGKVIPPGVRLTFPEGWTLQDMAARLTANGLPGEAVLAIARDPFPKWRDRFSFLQMLPAGVGLEGYFFPDTYIFPELATPELIVNTFLENFERHVTDDMVAQAKAKTLSLHQLITLASIVENEVRSEHDRRLVADLFLRRIALGQALQSDATLRYALGEKKIKYSIGDTQTISPYNTYKYVGLPPGPIGNPGIESIRAVLDPIPNPYLYFLNNPETGATVFAETFEEHVRNKAANGL